MLRILVTVVTAQPWMEGRGGVTPKGVGVGGAEVLVSDRRKDNGELSASERWDVSYPSSERQHPGKPSKKKPLGPEE
ncbi:unnamed protein product [Merluccius merluccius]